MEFNPVVITIAGVVLLVLGMGAGWLLGSVGTDESEPEPGNAEPAPPGGRKGRYTPVARLWREKKTGTLVVEMDGKAYTAAEGLNEIQRERLEKSARDLRVFAGMGLTTSEALEPVSAEEFTLDAVDIEPPPAPPPARSQPVPARATVAPSVPPVRPAQPAVTPQPSNPAPMRSTVRPTPPPPAPVPAKEKAAPVVKSIVMQIEDILQDMIAGTPLANRGLHLTEDPVRGVIVQLGLQFFEGIDAVTDPEAKAAIRAAVQQWENR